MGEGHILAIDAQSLEDDSLLILHCVNEREPEIGRAARKEAIGTLLKENLHRYTLAEILEGRPYTRIPVPAKSPEPVLEEDDTQYKLPSHIPSGTKLREEKIELFSLIKLTDEEIARLKHDMGDTKNEITIHNWPHETTASQSETYNIFQCVKPDLVAPFGQTFVMLIDTTHISEPERAPVVVVACESTPQGIEVEGRYSRLDQMGYKHIYLRAEKTQRIKELWPLIWHPPNRGSVNDVVVNYPLFYASSEPVVDWNSPVTRYRGYPIARPGAAIRAFGVTAPEVVVYILCPVTPEELRRLRNIITVGTGRPIQFLELDLVPREVRNEREEGTRQEPSGQPSTPLDPLLEFFDTPEYRAVADVPETFVFLDNDALDDLLAGAGASGSVPLATIHHHFQHVEEDTGSLIAQEEPAYLYANIEINDGLDSTLANLAVGNMWFWELANIYSDGIEVAFWPEYRGSMTREMLEIEE
jgi:hypothetical protein